MKRIISLLLFFICCFSHVIYAQVGIGTTNPHASSMLDVQATDKGILVPRVSLSSTSVQAPVTNPAEGLLIYNTSTAGDVTPGFYYWTGSGWKSLLTSGGGGGGAEGWGLRGNIVSDDDFIGTLQNYKPLKFRIDNKYFGQFHPQGGISLGLNAVANNDNGIALGENSNAGTSNSIAVGTDASTSTSNLSIAIGNLAVVSNHESVALGNNAKSPGHSAISLGVDTNASGEGSAALGREASASGQFSTAIGYGATVSQPNTIRLGNNDAKVGIGTSTPHVSSVLDISATNKGILIPRVALTSTTDQGTITQLAVSLLVYNTNTASDVTPGFYYWTGTVWKALSSSGGGGGGNSSFGERYYTTDEVVTLNQTDDIAAPNGTANPNTSTNITTSGSGLTLTSNGGVYKVTLTITYSKQVANPNVNSVEFFITKHGSKITNTSVVGELNDDLKRKTITIVKILTLDNWATYHFGVGKTDPHPGVNIVLHKDMTNMTIERID